MDLAAYLKKHGLSQEQFAKKIGSTQGAVSQWLLGRSRMSAERAAKIEQKTGGELRLQDLRPDLFRRRAA